MAYEEDLNYLLPEQGNQAIENDPFIQPYSPAPVIPVFPSEDTQRFPAAAPAVTPPVNPLGNVVRMQKKPVETTPVLSRPVAKSSELSMKYAGAKAQDWSPVERLSQLAKKKALEAEAMTKKGVKEYKATKYTDVPTPDYKAPLSEVEKETKGFKEAAAKNISDIEKQVAQYGDIAKAYNEEQEAVRAKYKEAVDPLERDLMDLQKNPPDLKNIDQSRVWKDRGVLGSIAVAISGIFAAKSETGFKYWSDYLKNSADRDIEAQKQDNLYRSEKFRSLSTGKQNLVSYYQNKYKDELAGIGAARVAALSSIQSQIALKSQNMTNKESLMNAQKALANIQIEINKTITDTLTQKRASEERKASADLTAMKVGAEALSDTSKMALQLGTLKEKELDDREKNSLLRAEVKAKSAADSVGTFGDRPTDDKYAVVIDRAFPPGGKNNERNKEAHKQLGILREQIAAKQLLREYFDKVREIGPFTNPFGKKAEELNTATLMLFPVIKKIVGERMSDADARTMVEPYLPTRFTPTDRLDERMKAMERAINSQLGDTSLVDSLKLRQAMEKEFEKAYSIKRKVIKD